MAGESRKGILSSAEGATRPETLRHKNGMSTVRTQRISKGSGE
jgi:hypothetical protein